MGDTETRQGWLAAKVIGPKRRWRDYQARKRRLPDDYRMAVDAIERYLMYFGAADGESAAALLEDLIELFEQAAADRTPIRSVVGDDPVEFANDLVRNYDQGGYVARERARLERDIAIAAGERPAG